jgi:hypothetical protein
MFNKGREELLKDTCPCAVIKKVLVERFTGKITDQYHYSQLQAAAQDTGETAEVYAYRCRKLSENRTVGRQRSRRRNVG